MTGLRYICLLIFISFSFYSQEEPGSRNLHVFGFGTQAMASSRKDPGAESSFITYNNKPGYFAFYEIMFPTKNNRNFALWVRTNYRAGYGENGYNGLSANSVTKGDFIVIRNELGFSFLKWRGKQKNILTGFGLYGGYLYKCSGTGEKYYSSFGFSSITSSDIKENLSPYSLGLNYELAYQIKMHKKNYFLTGINLRLESPEGFNSRLGKIAGFFVAYKFGKNAIIDNSQGTPGKR